jgi:phosphoglycerate dehydrogenase-like enzyme
MLKALYIMNPVEWPRVYPPDVQTRIGGLVQVLAPVLSPSEAVARPDLLAQMDILISGWGCPVLDDEFLGLAPNLAAIFYGAGTMAHLLTESFAKRRITVTTANRINAIPVSEFTLAHILLGMKRAWQQALETKRRRAFFLPQLPVAGAFQSTVGLISLSTIGRLVLERLESFDLRVIAYDPTIREGDARPPGVEMVSLETLFAFSDVVSLHAPEIPETVGMITGSLLSSMKSGATFINTARGSIVREQEMIDVLRSRPDLTAILDVTDPEPPLPGNALFELPNVVLTPHIAGSLDGECGRMGHWVADELERHLAGQPLLGLLPQPKASG